MVTRIENEDIEKFFECLTEAQEKGTDVISTGREENYVLFEYIAALFQEKRRMGNEVECLKKRSPRQSCAHAPRRVSLPRKVLLFLQDRLRDCAFLS